MRDQPGSLQRLYVAAALLVGIVAAGTAGYAVIQGWSWFDSLYVTIVTLTTLGGGEPSPFTTAGRWFTLALLVLGVGIVFYTLLAIVEFVLEGQLRAAMGSRRMRRRVAHVRDHFVLCGFGRVGREIAQQLAAERATFVVVDLNQSSLQEAAEQGYSVVPGNAADVAVLKEAGIECARGLITAVDSDADNIYVTLSARVLRPELFIVARANQADSEPKLRLAGANRVISPYTIGGRRMANLAMRPTAVEFVDTVLSASQAELLLEDLAVRAESRWVGQPLEALIGDGDVVVLAIKRGASMLFRPAGAWLLQTGDELVAAGSPAAIKALEAAL